jgi:hypothetical protein
LEREVVRIKAVDNKQEFSGSDPHSLRNIPMNCFVMRAQCENANANG